MGLEKDGGGGVRSSDLQLPKQVGIQDLRLHGHLGQVTEPPPFGAGHRQRDDTPLDPVMV